MEKAIFAAGCFWGVEEEFRTLEGVKSTRAGYTGGHTENPSYEDVCSNSTGHAEAVEIEYDPKIINYDKLLDVFFSLHDPTQVNRQGLDIGTQYRSVIFYTTDDQRRKAHKRIVEEQEKYKKPIATDVLRAHEFYPAEEYHQKYLMKKGLKVCN